MGTRALVRIFEGDTELVTIYLQNDGYPEGLGAQVANFCAQRRIVNGLNSRQRPNSVANGMGCLAASIVALLKDDVGRVYIYPTGAKDVGEEYEYHVKGPPKWTLPHGGEAIVVEAYSVVRPREMVQIALQGAGEHTEDEGGR